MLIHTLGPAETDSYAAAQHYCQTHPKEHAHVFLHASFEEVLTQLTAYRGGAYLLLPAAFKSKMLKLSWGELHYDLLDQLQLIDCFIYQLAPLVIIENQTRLTGIAYSHAATAKLLAKTVTPQKIKCCASKYLAYQQFLQDGQYVLTNQKNVELHSDDRIIAHFKPDMVWCLYQIKE